MVPDKKKKKKKKQKNKFPVKIVIFLGVLVVSIAYFMFSPLSMVNHTLFQPLKASSYADIPGELLGAKRVDVTFESESGNSINGILFEMPGAKYTFLLSHGQGGNISKHMGLVKTALLNGQSVLTYDYSGYGISSGEPSVNGLVEDGTAAFDFLVKKKGIKPDRIILYGASLGSGVAGTVALSRPPAGIILVCPYDSLKRLARERLPYLNIYPDFLFPQPDIGSSTFLRHNMVVPVMIIHGEKDRTISVQHSKDLFKIRPYKTKLVLKPDKHHGDFSTAELAADVAEFLNSINGAEYTTRENGDETLNVH